MNKFGLIGYPLEHSFSAEYFSRIFEKESCKNVEYKLYPIKDISTIREFAETNSLKAFNVTIPYKQTIIPFLDVISDDAAKVGAVNTVVVEKSGQNQKLHGYNTDVFGFMKSIEPYLCNKIIDALVLGSGGASKAVTHCLDALGISYKVVSRKPLYKDHISYDDVNEIIITNTQLIVNATPLGMFPNVNASPDIPFEFINTSHVIFDLIYNPEMTLFLKQAEQKGATVLNGLEMLYLQADKSWEIFRAKLD